MIPKKLMRVIVAGLLPSFCLSARSAETPIQPSRYLLIEATAVTDLDEVPNQSPANQKTGSKTDSALDRFLKEPRHGKWKVFEDDLVTFSYPGYPGMQVAARDGRPAPGTKFYGDPIGSVNRQSNRFYSVLVEGVTWAVVMLQDDPWFDEGICFCGEVGMRVYVADSGCLRAYDLLTTGRLKKLQVSNGGKRLQVFESTHLPMSQENYLHFTGSLAFRNPGTKSPAEWMEEFKKKDQRDGAFGWLRPGMSKEEAIALLGPPDQEDGTSLIYKSSDSDKVWLTTKRIPFPGGIFARFPANWQTTEEIPPAIGTLRWAEKILDKDGAAIASADMELLKKSCLENLPACPADDWNGWVSVARALVERKWNDTALASLILARFLDDDVSVNIASILIGDLNPLGTQEAVTKRLRFVLDRTAAPSVPAEDWLPGPLDDFHNLLVQIKDNDQRLGFIKEGINHPHPDVRWTAYLWWLHRLPPDDALAAARKGLDDSNERVRLESAEAFTETLGTKSDLEWLANHV